jgi:hypothetical protein
MRSSLRQVNAADAGVWLKEPLAGLVIQEQIEIEQPALTIGSPRRASTSRMSYLPGLPPTAWNKV